MGSNPIIWRKPGLVQWQNARQNVLAIIVVDFFILVV